MESLLKHGSFSVLMLTKKFLNNEQEKSFGKAVQVTQDMASLFGDMTMTFAVMCLLSTFVVIFSKTCGILCLFMFPTVSSTYFF